MKDSVDVLIEQWTAALGDIDPRVEGIVTRMQLIVRHVSSRKAESVAALGMQMWECATLYALRRRGKPYAAGPTELAAELGITGAAMTNRVDAMVRRGYVVRRYDRDDRRRNVVALTRKGVAAAERIVAGQRDVEADLIATLTDAQQEQLITLLRRLMQAVDATI
ncbi:MAG TPA: MarR family winged helix-turn-helix transcriptional regulator [Jatrophihabitantaceae bacterium]|nr:MarR family winged helix-turn-helix transcriptional regulator [Jatrophihabitantaceae bacterium]